MDRTSRIYKFACFCTSAGWLHPNGHEWASAFWSDLNSSFSDKFPSKTAAARWARTCNIAFEQHLKQESKKSLLYLFGETDFYQELVQFLIRDFILEINQHKRDEFPMSLGATFQTWLSLFCQALETFAGTKNISPSVKILAVKASSKPPTKIIPRPQMSQLKKLYSTDPLDIADDPLSFVPTEILHFEEAYDKRFENTSVTAIAVKQKPSTASSCVKTPEHFAHELLKPIQPTTENPPGFVIQKPSTALRCVKTPEHIAHTFENPLQSTTENPPDFVEQQSSTALSCVKTSEHFAHTFENPLQPTTDMPGCVERQYPTSVFPDFEQLYQEFCTIFFWDQSTETTNLKLDNSSRAQSFLSFAAIPAQQSSNVENTKTPNFSSESSRTSAYVKSFSITQGD